MKAHKNSVATVILFTVVLIILSLPWVSGV